MEPTFGYPKSIYLAIQLHAKRVKWKQLQVSGHSGVSQRIAEDGGETGDAAEWNTHGYGACL